jgi:hypothetical protein
VKKIPEEARAAADAMAAASWEVAALARYRFDIEDVQGTQRRPTRRELAEKEARESEAAKLEGGEDAEVAKACAPHRNVYTHSSDFWSCCA